MLVSARIIYWVILNLVCKRLERYQKRHQTKTARTKQNSTTFNTIAFDNKSFKFNIRIIHDLSQWNAIMVESFGNLFFNLNYNIFLSMTTHILLFSYLKCKHKCIIIFIFWTRINWQCLSDLTAFQKKNMRSGAFLAISIR